MRQTGVLTKPPSDDSIVYNASRKDRYSRFTELKRSHARLKAGMVGILLVPALVYFTAGAALA